MYASMAKAFAGDHCNKVATDAVQIFGGIVNIFIYMLCIIRFRCCIVCVLNSVLILIPICVFCSQALALTPNTRWRSCSGTPRFTRFMKAPAISSAWSSRDTWWPAQAWSLKLNNGNRTRNSICLFLSCLMWLFQLVNNACYVCVRCARLCHYDIYSIIVMNMNNVLMFATH